MADCTFTRRGVIASSLLLAGAFAGGLIAGLVSAAPRPADTGKDEEEQWRPIRGGLSKHEVSSLGRVRDRAGNLVRPFPDVDGRNVVSWSFQLGDSWYSDTFHVDHLVLDSFLSKRRKRFFPEHLNGIPGDDRLANLQWVERKVPA